MRTTSFRSLLVCLLLVVPGKAGASAVSNDACGLPFASFSVSMGNVGFPVRLAQGRATISMPQAHTCFSAYGGILDYESDLKDYQGSFDAGWACLHLETSRFTLSFDGGKASFPDETHILHSKPRYMLNDGSGEGLSGLVSYRFSRWFGLAAAGCYFDGSFASGDLYYFYGRPSDIRLKGGTISLLGPFRSSLTFLGSRLHVDVQSNEDIKLGEGEATLNGVLLGKDFRFGESRHQLSFTVGYLKMEYLAGVLATSETQDYAFFPYKRIAGTSNGTMHLALGNLFYSYQGTRLSASLDVGVLVCIDDALAANYRYTYKHTIFFNGTTHIGRVIFPGYGGDFISFGKGSLSYTFSLSHAQLTLSCAKLFAFVADPSAFRSQQNDASSAESSSDNDPSFWDMLLFLLKTGTFLSVRVSF